MIHLSSNGDLNLDTGLDIDDDLLDDLSWCVKTIELLVRLSYKAAYHNHGITRKEGYLLDEALVDAHLKGVPGLGTLTTGGLAGGDLEGLGWQTDGALDAEVLGLGTLNELGADLLEGVDLAGGEGDTDAVDFLGNYASVRYISRDTIWTSQCAQCALQRWEYILGPRRTPSLAFGKTS